MLVAELFARDPLSVVDGGTAPERIAGMTSQDRDDAALELVCHSQGGLAAILQDLGMVSP